MSYNGLYAIKPDHTKPNKWLSLKKKEKLKRVIKKDKYHGMLKTYIIIIIMKPL